MDLHLTLSICIKLETKQARLYNSPHKAARPGHMQPKIDGASKDYTNTSRDGNGSGLNGTRPNLLLLIKDGFASVVGILGSGWV